MEGERFWLQLRGQEVPERSTRRSSLGHSHVLGPELRNFAGARSVLFKLLAKAAMRLRADDIPGEGPFLARGMAIRIRFVGLERRFERDLAFAPLDDTPTLLHLLGEQLAQLERHIASGRWNPRRHPPLSVAVTLLGLETAGEASGELIQRRDRDRDTSRVVDRINRRYGNNAVFFGAMKHAIDHDAAPMRIPFSHIPRTAREQDIGTRGNGGDELMLRRERQYKVLAETAHREAQKRHARPRRGAGAGDRAQAAAAEPSSTGTRAEPDIGETLPLF